MASIPPAGVVDASVWIAYYSRRDQFHRRTSTWLQTQLSSSAVLAAPGLLLAEVAGVLVRQLKQSTSLARAAQIALRAVHQLEQEPQLLIVAVDSALITRAYQVAITLQLRGTDAVYAALAQQLGVPLYSWDNEHIQRAGALTPP